MTTRTPIKTIAAAAIALTGGILYGGPANATTCISNWQTTWTSWICTSCGNACSQGTLNARKLHAWCTGDPPNCDNDGHSHVGKGFGADEFQNTVCVTPETDGDTVSTVQGDCDDGQHGVAVQHFAYQYTP